jgi:hypothetical protein
MTGHTAVDARHPDSRTASPTVTLDASAFIQFQRAVQLLCDSADTLTTSPSPQTVADRLTDLPHRFDEDAETVEISRANLAALGDVLRPLLDALSLAYNSSQPEYSALSLEKRVWDAVLLHSSVK